MLDDRKTFLFDYIIFGKFYLHVDVSHLYC
jgi:hypothetical protein